MPRNIWTQKEVDILFQYYPNYSKINQALVDAGFIQRGKDAMQKRHERGPEVFDPKVKEIFVTPREFQRRAAYHADGIEEILKHTKPLPPAKVQPIEEALCVPICDPHFGDRIIAMDGTEVWNTARAVEIFDKYSNKSIEILGLHNRSKKSIGKVYILACGDNLTGETTYEGQLSQLDQFLDEQLETACSCFWRMIISFRDLFSVPVEIVLVNGNHASGKGGSPYNGGDAYLAVALKLLAIERGDNQITVNTSKLNFNIVNVNGHNVMIRHKAVKHGGTPAQKVKVMNWANKEYDPAVVDAKRHRCRLIVGGHFHEVGLYPVGDVLLMNNGSIKPYDAFADQIGAAAAPRYHWIFGVSKSHCPSFQYMIEIR